MTTVDDRCRHFFRLFSTSSSFSIFPKKVTGQYSSEKVLGRPGGVREGFLGHSGGLQEGSWGAPGLSGGVRGASWEGLGRSWGDLGATFKAVRFQIVFLIDFERQKGAQREAFGEPKWSQNQSKNNAKSKSIFKSEKVASCKRFEPILGRFGGCRRGIFIDFLLVFLLFRENRRFGRR